MDIDFLIPELRGKAISLLLLSLMLAMGFLQMLFIRLRTFSSVSTLWSVFNYEEVLDFFKMVFVDQLINSLSRSFYTYTSSPFPVSPSLSHKHTGSRESRLDTTYEKLAKRGMKE